MAKKITLTKDYSGDTKTSTFEMSEYRINRPTTFAPNQRWAIGVTFRGDNGIVLERFMSDDPKDEGPNKDDTQDLITSLNTGTFSVTDQEETILDAFVAKFPELAGTVS